MYYKNKFINNQIFDVISKNKLIIAILAMVITGGAIFSSCEKDEIYQKKDTSTINEQSILSRVQKKKCRVDFVIEVGGNIFQVAGYVKIKKKEVVGYDIVITHWPSGNSIRLTGSTGTDEGIIWNLHDIDGNELPLDEYRELIDVIHEHILNGDYEGEGEEDDGGEEWPIL